MTTTELSELIIAKLGVKPWDLSNEPFGVRFDHRGSRYFVDINLMVEKVDGTCLVTDSDALQLEKLLRGEQWDGTGLPPVGTECEVIAHNNRWGMTAGVVYKGTLVAHSGDDFWFRSEDNVNFISRNDKVDFRPLRTERDKAIEQISNIAGVFANQSVSEQIYDAIIAGKIDGLGKVG